MSTSCCPSFAAVYHLPLTVHYLLTNVDSRFESLELPNLNGGHFICTLHPFANKAASANAIRSIGFEAFNPKFDKETERSGKKHQEELVRRYMKKIHEKAICRSRMKKSYEEDNWRRYVKKLHESTG